MSNLWKYQSSEMKEVAFIIKWFKRENDKSVSDYISLILGNCHLLLHLRLHEQVFTNVSFYRAVCSVHRHMCVCVCVRAPASMLGTICHLPNRKFYNLLFKSYFIRTEFTPCLGVIFHVSVNF